MEEDMQNLQTAVHNHSTGEPRKHHEIYFEDGNFVIQVENAILKVHRSLFARFSTVIKDMLDAPSEDGSKDGTDEKPLILTGDSVSGWEMLLGLQYSRPRLECQDFNGESMLLILPVAHKYCMNDVEVDVIKGLKKNTSIDGYVDLMVASQIIGSDELYQAGLRGAEATHAVMTAAHIAAMDFLRAKRTTAMSNLNKIHATTLNVAIAERSAALDNQNNQKCRHCHLLTKCNCPNCLLTQFQNQFI